MNLAPRYSILKAIVVAGLVAGVVFGLVRLPRSDWNKERILRNIQAAKEDDERKGIVLLVRLGAESQLLRLLHRSSPALSEMAQNGLWDLWCREAGDEVYRQILNAEQAAAKRQNGHALAILNGVVTAEPDFAEGWNRRGLLHCQMDHHQKAVADFKRAVEIKPHHFGAWQGMGVSYIYMGSFAPAARAFKAALKINPNSRETRLLLKQCEEILREHPPTPKQRKLFV